MSAVAPRRSISGRRRGHHLQETGVPGAERHQGDIHRARGPRSPLASILDTLATATLAAPPVRIDLRMTKVQVSAETSLLFGHDALLHAHVSSQAYATP